MNRNDVLRAALSALDDLTGQLCELLRRQDSLAAAVGGGSTWTVREAAVHLVVCANVHAEIACGAASPVRCFAGPDLATFNAQSIADIPEADPDKVAHLLGDAVHRFTRTAAERQAHLPARYHGGLPVDVADVAVLLAAEVAVHGHDIARAYDLEWVVPPPLARLVLVAWSCMLADPGAVVLDIAGRTALPLAAFPDLFLQRQVTHLQKGA